MRNCLPSFCDTPQRSQEMVESTCLASMWFLISPLFVLSYWHSTQYQTPVRLSLDIFLSMMLSRSSRIYYLKHIYIYTDQILWCLELWVCNAFLVGQMYWQNGHITPPVFTCLASMWHFILCFTWVTKSQLEHWKFLSTQTSICSIASSRSDNGK